MRTKSKQDILRELHHTFRNNSYYCPLPPRTSVCILDNLAHQGSSARKIPQNGKQTQEDKNNSVTCNTERICFENLMEINYKNNNPDRAVLPLKNTNLTYSCDTTCTLTPALHSRPTIYFTSGTAEALTCSLSPYAWVVVVVLWSIIRQITPPRDRTRSDHTHTRLEGSTNK